MSNGPLQRFALHSFAFVFGGLAAFIVALFVYFVVTSTGVDGIYTAYMAFGWCWKGFMDALAELLGLDDGN